MELKDIGISLIGIAVILMGIAQWNLTDRVTALESYTQPTVPATVLVGVGCQGSSDLAVAFEEDAMPQCQRIDRVEIAQPAR